MLLLSTILAAGTLFISLSSAAPAIPPGINCLKNTTDITVPINSTTLPLASVPGSQLKASAASMIIRGPIPEGYIPEDGLAYYFPEGSDASLKARNQADPRTDTIPDQAEGQQQNTPRNAGGQIGIGMYTMYGADGTAFYVDDVAYNINYSSPAFPAKDKVCFLSVVVKYRGLHPHEQLDFSIWHDNDPCGRFVGSAGAVDGKYSHWDAPPFSCFRLWAKEP